MSAGEKKIVASPNTPPAAYMDREAAAWHTHVPSVVHDAAQGACRIGAGTANTRRFTLAVTVAFLRDLAALVRGGGGAGP